MFLQMFMLTFLVVLQARVTTFKHVAGEVRPFHYGSTRATLPHASCSTRLSHYCTCGIITARVASLQHVYVHYHRCQVNTVCDTCWVITARVR